MSSGGKWHCLPVYLGMVRSCTLSFVAIADSLTDLVVVSGGYDKEDKAARAYDLAALKFWGPSSHINFPVIVQTFPFSYYIVFYHLLFAKCPMPSVIIMA